MLKIVSDADIEGHVDNLVALIRRSEWSEYWKALDIELCRFEDFSLGQNANDRTVWNAVQKNHAVLITANRNEDDENSLQATINDSNQLWSLPVITISKVQRISIDRAYADRVVQKLMEYLFDIEQFRGTGRLYIP